MLEFVYGCLDDRHDTNTVRSCFLATACTSDIGALHFLYHAQVLLLPLRPRGVRMQAPPRAADRTLAQTTRALKPIVERGGERLVRSGLALG